MREAAEPEESAAEEKVVESKSEERNEEKIGSDVKESSGDGDGVSGVWGVGVGLVVVADLKVERR